MSVTISRSVATAVIDLLRLITRLRYMLRLLGNGDLLEGRAFDDLVQLTPVKPDTPTFRAIIDFHSLTIRHDKVNGRTDWAFHDETSLVFLFRPEAIYFWLIADNRQGLLPTGRVKVQSSSNFTGSVLLPDTTAPVASSVVKSSRFAWIRAVT